MKRIRTLLIVAASIGAAFVASARAAVNIGAPARDFTLRDIDGKAHRLADYRGKTVVLEWNNPECPFVHKHYDSGNIPALQRAATSDGVVWLLINSGAPGSQGADYTAAQIREFLTKRGAAPTAYLRDPTGTVGRLYGAKTTPHLFVITGAGTLVYDGAIDSIRSADKADIPRATNYVRAALADVKAGRPVGKPSTQPYGCSVHY